jgi:heme exporter protein A
MLEAVSLTCVRGDRPLFAGASFAVEPGQAVYVTGSNGAGKTSMLRLLCGLATPEVGEVRWQGEPIRSLREEFSRNLAFVGHAAALKDDLSACENLLTGTILSGRRLDRDHAVKALWQMGLKGREDLPARVLSQGQRRRVNLARLVLPDPPRLWVLDEPFNALDARAVKQLRQILLDHVGGGGMLVFTTHQEVEFPAAMQKRILIERGRAELC